MPSKKKNKQNKHKIQTNKNKDPIRSPTNKTSSAISCSVDKYQILIPLFFIFAIFLANLTPIADNDLGFHLQIGKETLEAGFPQKFDNHSFTLPRAEYPNHEWLIQLMLYSYYYLSGITGLVILKGLLLAFVLSLTYQSLKGSTPLKLGLLWIVFILADNHVQMRPHMSAWCLFALLHFILSRTKYWALPVLFLFWGNIHGSVLLAVGLCFLHFLEEFYKHTKLSSLLWLLACFFIPLINPNGIGIYTIFFEINQHTDFIGEWKAYTSDTIAYWGLISLAGLCLLGILRFCPFNLFSALKIFILLFLAFKSSRNGIIAAIYLSPLVSRFLEEDLNFLSKRLSQCLNLILLSSAIFFFIFRIHSKTTLEFKLDQTQLPIAATEFIKRHQLENPIFNDYNFGGYLLWRANPDYPVFIDGRTEVFKGEVLENYLKISNAKAGWQDIVKDYGIKTFIIRPERLIAQELLKSANWSLVYFDYNSLIFTTKDSAATIKRLNAITPFGQIGSDKQAEAELQYLIKENPHFFGAYKILAFLKYKLGDIPAASKYMNQYINLKPKKLELKPKDIELLTKLK